MHVYKLEIGTSEFTISTSSDEKICLWDRNMCNDVSMHITILIPVPEPQYRINERR